jgi:hypothetical protein
VRKLKTDADLPANRWRLAVHTAGSPVYEPCRSEAATRTAVEAAKTSTTGDLIVVQKLNAQTGRWQEWLRWVRHDGTWNAE